MLIFLDLSLGSVQLRDICHLWNPPSEKTPNTSFGKLANLHSRFVRLVYLKVCYLVFYCLNQSVIFFQQREGKEIR